MKYKVLVLDIDGTLRTSDKRITKTNYDAIQKLMNDGVKVVIASGRPTYGVVPTAKELGLDKKNGYILSFNGGVITNCTTGERLCDYTLPTGTIARIGAFAAKHGCNMLSYDGDRIITDNPDNPFAALESRICALPMTEVLDWHTYDNLAANKCMILHEGHILEHLEPIAQAEFGAEMNVFRSEPFFLEIVPKGIDKARSLAILLEKFGLTKDDMVACGDGFNDLSMIQFAGMGVAMANAQPQVKEVADFITLSNDEDGVAYAIKKLFY
ncbi:MAG: HAD family phosphatase [Lachnospiraceae bacterium]|nr:HAD family phosphatase [Lachnospiraceae bacterium]